MKKAIPILFFLWTVTFSAQEFTITGNFTGFDEGTMFYLEDTELETYIDSAEIKDNQVVFKGELQIHTPKLLFIYSFGEGDEDFVWCNLFVGNEEVTVTADRKDFPFRRKVEGSKHQDVKNQLEDKMRPQSEEYLALHYQLMDQMYEADPPDTLAINRTNQQIDSISKIMRPMIREFIETNLNSYAGLNELYEVRKMYSKDSLQLFYDRLLPNTKIPFMENV